MIYPFQLHYFWFTFLSPGFYDCIERENLRLHELCNGIPNVASLKNFFHEKQNSYNNNSLNEVQTKLNI